MAKFSEKMDEALRPIYKQRVPIVFLKGVTIAVSLVPPLLMGMIINSLDDGQGGFALQLVAISAGVLVLHFLLDWAQDYYWHKMEYVGTGLIRSYIFKNVLRKDYFFWSKHNVGEVESKVIHDTEIYAHSRISSMPMLFLNIMHISIILIISILINLHMAMSVLAFSAIFFLVYKFINKRLRRSARRERAGYTNMLISSNEILAGANTIQLYGKEEYFAKRFEKDVDKYEHLLIRLRRWKGLAHSSTNKIVGFLPLVAIFVGLGLYSTGEFALGYIVTLCLILPYLAVPIAALTEFNIDFQNARAVEHRLSELLEDEEEDISPEITVINRITSLEFDNICYKYDNGKEVLWDVNFKVESGDALAVVGRSGTGKTTFLRMLKSQLKPSWGNIYVNKTHYEKVNKKSYINRIAVLTQNVFIFDASIRDNIKFGKDLSDDDVEKFAKLSALGRMDLDTSAKDLSGGERQRMGLARALACEYDILILDEPTKELDADTESKIINNLKAIQEETGCIFIIITHSENILENLCNKTLELKRKRKKTLHLP